MDGHNGQRARSPHELERVLDGRIRQAWSESVELRQRVLACRTRSTAWYRRAGGS